MIYENRIEFKKVIGKNTRLLGLDIGTKTIGVALSDSTHMIATPHITIKRGKFSKDIVILNDLINENEVSGLVVGLPINMKGEDTPQTQSVRQFVRNYLKENDIAVLFWDERFSTVAVERTLLEADMSRQKRAKVIDKMAASFILQGFLDSL
jgi:putative Holliday junction resolvase